MEKQTTDTLIRELITLDPSLSSHEADLRVLVSRMLEHRPVVSVDAEFRDELRKALMSAHMRAQVETRGTPSFLTIADVWITRLIPISALALVVLMLVPDNTHRLPSDRELAPDAVRESIVDPRIVDIEIGGGSTPTPPPSYFGMGGGGEGPWGSAGSGEPSAKSSAVQEDSAFGTGMADTSLSLPGSAPAFQMEATGMPRVEGGTIIFDTLTFPRSGFAVAYTYGPDGSETVSGVSPLLPPGTHERVTITLTEKESASYTVLLHEDARNDGAFVYGIDAPLLDSFGNPYSFVVTPLP